MNFAHAGYYTHSYNNVNAHAHYPLVHSFSMGIRENVTTLIDEIMARESVSFNEVARRMKVNQPTLLRIYNGESKSPRQENLLQIAKFFGVTVDALYGSRAGLAPTTGPSKPTGAAHEGATSNAVGDTAMLRSHVDMLRKSAQHIADQFGLSAEQVLASAMPVKRKASAANVDERVDERRWPRAPGTAPPTPRPTMESDYDKWAAESDPANDKRDFLQEDRRKRSRRTS